jgi:hypothetical protein
MVKRLKTKASRGSRQSHTESVTGQKSTSQRGASTRTPGTMGIKPSSVGLFNRNIFNDPFFTDPWEDLFNFPSFDSMINKAKEITKKAIKEVEHPTKGSIGSKYSRSHYRTSSGDNKGELISQESITDHDEKGRKFTEKKKTYENLKDRTVKTTHTKMIDNKGIKHMKTINLETGEEYEHNDFRHMSEKELDEFNKDFRKGIKGGLAQAQLERGRDFNIPRLGWDMDRHGIFGMDRPYGAWGNMFPSLGDFGYGGDYGFPRYHALGSSNDRSGTPTSAGEQDRHPYRKSNGRKPSINT